MPTIALVGARAATGYGEHVAMEASAGLVDRGFAIVSGGAYGIDGMAHRAALASDGTTIAFLAGGIDRFYPLGHESLLTRIAQTGAVVSELPCGAAPTKWRFLQRNRLIAAASQATVVLEAGIRSGSLNTAGHAAALGPAARSGAGTGDESCVGRMPPPAPRVRCDVRRRRRPDGRTRDHSIGSTVGRADLDASGRPAPGPDESDSVAASGAVAVPRGQAAASDPEAIRVLDAMSTRKPRELSDVAARAGLAATEAMSVLGRLEADGAVERRPGGWLRRRAG